MSSNVYGDIDKHYLAMQLRNIRDARGLTSQEAAKRIGISAAAYSKYETEKVESPTLKFINKLLIAYPDKTEKDFIRQKNVTTDGEKSILNEEVRAWMKTREGEIYIMQAYVDWLKDNKNKKE